MKLFMSMLCTIVKDRNWHWLIIVFIFKKNFFFFFNRQLFNFSLCVHKYGQKQTFLVDNKYLYRKFFLVCVPEAVDNSQSIIGS